MIITRGNRLVRVHAKARVADDIRDDPLIVMRHALADRWFRKYRREMLKQLNAQTIEASKRVAAGSTEPVTDTMETQWYERLLKVKRPMVLAMVRSGTALTDAVEFGKKSIDYFPGVLGPGVNPFAGKADPVGLEAVGYDEEAIFLHQAETQNIEAYLQETSKKETATSRKKLDKLYKDANSYWDDELQRGLTPKEVAKQMTQQGLADNATRATMMSRTTTMWAYNEGAMQSYINAGVPAMSWVVANDDVLCFPKWTMVLTPGGQVPIQKIKVGDLVRNATGIGKVLATGVKSHTNEMTVFVAGGNTVYCTSNHPIFVKGLGWTEAKDLNISNFVQLSNDEFAKVLCSFNFFIGHPNDCPSVFLKVSRLASVLRRIIMPIASVYFKSYFKSWNDEVNAPASNFSFLDKRNLQGFEGFSNRSFKSIFTGIFSVAGLRTKDPVRHWRGPKFLSAGFTGEVLRRTITFFRTVFTMPYIALKNFPTSCAFNSFLEPRPALPTADGVPVSNSFRFGEGFSANGANFRDHFRSMGKSITFSTTEFPGRCTFRSVKSLLAKLAGNFFSGTCAIVVTLIRAINSFLSGTGQFCNWLSTPFTLQRFHSSTPLILTSILYHIWHGKVNVFNLQIEKSPTYFANSVLVHNCEFCVQMDGQIVRTGDPFLPSGTELPGLDGGTLDIPEEWSIGHPPLHPMCRCTTVPIVVETEVRVITEAADKLRDDYTKKIADGTMKEARARRAQLLRRRRKPKPARKKVPRKKEPTPFEETKETKKTLEKKKPKVPEPVSKPEPVVLEEPAWTPAKTKSDGTQWAEDNIINPKSSRIDIGNPVTGYEKLRMESVNVINEELTTLTRKYGIKLNGIDARALGHAEADVFAGMTRGRVLDVNTKYWNRLDAFGKHVTRLNADGWHASRTVQDILTHEYGHGIVGNSSQKLKLIGDAFKANRANLVTSVSRYGATTPVEMWAEIFVKFDRGRKLPQWADDLARKVLKKPARKVPKVQVKKPPKKVVREAARGPKVVEQPIELSKAQKNTLDSIDKLREQQWKNREGIQGYFPTRKDLSRALEKLEKKINKLEDQILKVSKKQLKSTNRKQAIKELGERSEGLPTFEWMSTLTDAETKGLGEWMTENGVEKIRRVYNPAVKSSKHLVEAARKIEEALARGEAYRGTAYRGIGDLKKSVYESLKETKELRWDALTSATKDIDVATGFTGFGDQVVFVIKGNKSGVQISPLWRQIHKIRELDEILIKPGARYKVVKVTEKKIMQPDYFKTHFGRNPKLVNRLTVQLKEI